MDRGTIDFKKLRREKDKDLKENVKQKKDELDIIDEQKKYSEIEAKDEKIRTLQLVKER